MNDNGETSRANGCVIKRDERDVKTNAKKQHRKIDQELLVRLITL